MIAHALFQSNYLKGESLSHAMQLRKDHKLLVLHGGEDISPLIYGERSVYAQAADHLSRRDAAEIQFVEQARILGIPILGICRGAQLLCCLGGGSLWQDVSNHAGRNHELLFRGETYWTNSVHHQMMRPTEDMEILAVSPNRSPIKYDESEHEDLGDEPEIVYIPDLKALCVQGHPEWLGSTAPLVQITNQLMKEKFNV